MSRGASPQTRDAYRADWQLFQDWCSAAGVDAVAATPADVLTFLAENPASIAGQQRRVAALNWMHRSLGVHVVPGRERDVLDALHPPRVLESHRRNELVAQVLEMVPSHGWPTGAFGRRDRALLVLSQRAGLTFEALQNLTRGEVTITADGLTVGDGRGLVTLERVPDDAVQCSVCAWARWMRVLDLGVGRASQRPLARALAQARPVTKTSTHQCAVPATPDARPDDPVFIPLSRWGDIAIRPAALYASSAADIVQAHLAGTASPHDPLNWAWLVPEIETEPAPGSAGQLSGPAPDLVSLRERMAAGVARRTADRDTVNWADAALMNVADEGDELMRRSEQLLALAVDTTDGLRHLMRATGARKPAPGGTNLGP